MADRAIGELPAAQNVDDTSLLAVEQQGRAMKMTGAQFKEFAKAGVKTYVTQAATFAEKAEISAKEASYSAKEAADQVKRASNEADRAEQNANDAASSALTAAQYSGKPPIIQNNHWWTWDATAQQYVDTGEVSRGNVMYATFAVDPATGELWMYTDEEYNGPTFAITNGNLEVILNYGN